MFKSNFNKLMPHHCIGPVGCGAPYKALCCEIRKVDSLDAEPLPIEDPMQLSNTLGVGFRDGDYSTELPLDPDTNADWVAKKKVI